MILSMTGYGAAHAVEDGVNYTVEIRCLNNRYYKAGYKLAEGFQSLESKIDGWLRETLVRGSITYALRVRDGSPNAAHEVNIAAVESYVAQLSRVKGIDPARLDPTGLMALPGVCEPTELDEATFENRAAVVRRLTDEAVRGVMDMRRTEGLATRKHLLEQCGLIRTDLEVIRQRSPQVVLDYRQKIETRVARLLSESKLELEKDALMREIAIFADRCDISEEITRLTSHLDQFAAMCDSKDPAGRRLDFLTQEMLREANTIGSKANDSVIARHTVEIKAAIERIKEQVQNVE